MVPAGDVSDEAGSDPPDSDEVVGDSGEESSGDQDSNDDEESMAEDQDVVGDEDGHGDESMAMVASEAADGQDSSDNEESMAAAANDGRDCSDDESMATVAAEEATGDQDSSDNEEPMVFSAVDEGIKDSVETLPKEADASELQNMLAQFDSDDNDDELDASGIPASEAEDRSDASDQDSDFEEGLTDAETLVLGQHKDDDSDDTVPDWYDAWRSPNQAEDDCSVHDVPDYGEPSPPMLKKHKFFVGPKEPQPGREPHEQWPVAMDDNGVAVKSHVLAPPADNAGGNPRFVSQDQDSSSKPEVSVPKQNSKFTCNPSKLLSSIPCYFVCM